MRALAILGLVVVSTPAFAYPLPPSILATNALAQKGFLDATLYAGIDPTGVTDSTAGLQKALDDGYAYGLTVFLPSGTYLVSNSLHEDQIWNLSGCAEKVPGYGGVIAQLRAPGLVGAVHPSRPKIVLANNSAGFNDPTNPKAVVAFRNLRTPATSGYPAWMGEADCGFRMVMRGFDVSLGSGNAGAIGVQNPSAQYSTVEDLNITATGGYAGMRGSVTTESMVNINVTGGQFGIITDVCCGVSIAGLVLTDQTVASLWANSFGTTTVSGFSFSPAAGASAVLVGAPVSQAGMLTLIDGTITLPAGVMAPAINNANQRGIYLGGVYVKTPSPLITNGAATPVTVASGWQLVSEYSFTDTNGYALPSGQVSSVSLVDGVLAQTPRLSASAVTTPPTDLVARHAWTSIPSFDDAGVKDVMDADIGAKGDGVTDDSAAIQKALDNYTVVFLPRGDYLLGKEVVMHKGNRLLGVPGHLSRLFPNWNPGTTFGHAITTDVAKHGDAYLGDIHIVLPKGAPASYIGAVHWRIGRNSIVRHIGIEEYYEDRSLDVGTVARKVVDIDGGGGRWYGLDVDGSWRSNNVDYRGVLVTGTQEPTSFYGLNIEHNGGAQIEVASSSNVRILGTKTETHDFALFDNSSNVMLAGLTGNTGGVNNLVQFTDTTNVLSPNLSIYAGEHAGDTGPIVIEKIGTNSYSTAAKNNCSVLRRGAFDETTFNTVTSASAPTTTPACGDGICSTGETCSSCPADCSCGPGVAAACAAAGAVTVDGDASDWVSVSATPLPSSRVVSGSCTGDADCSAIYRTQWDAQNLYVLVEVIDDVVTGTSASPLYVNDSTELYLDGGDERAASYDSNDFQLTIDWQGHRGGTNAFAITFASAAARTAQGYTIEYAVPWTALGRPAVPGLTVGFDLAVNDNDADDGTRDAQIYWFGDGTGWNSPSTWGSLTLVEAVCGQSTSDGGDGGTTQGGTDGGTGNADGGTMQGGTGDATAASMHSGGCSISGNAPADTVFAIGLLLLAVASRRVRPGRCGAST